MLHLSRKRLEQRLDLARFVRIHRTQIVNLDHVVAFKRQIDRARLAEPVDGTRLAVSRAKAQELRGLAR